MFPSQKLAVLSRDGAVEKASMGPGCFHPRNVANALAKFLHQALQWGRDVSIPEIYYERIRDGDLDPLQWGRDVSIPEMFLAEEERKRKLALQWGRDVSIPEILLAMYEGFTRDASMGPGCFHPRNRNSRPETHSVNALQWGRDVSIPEIHCGTDCIR